MAPAPYYSRDTAQGSVVPPIRYRISWAGPSTSSKKRLQSRGKPEGSCIKIVCPDQDRVPPRVSPMLSLSGHHPGKHDRRPAARSDPSDRFLSLQAARRDGRAISEEPDVW